MYQWKKSFFNIFFAAVCISVSAAYGNNKTASGRVVCDDTCKVESTARTGLGNAPLFSVVSPVGHSSVKRIKQA